MKKIVKYIFIIILILTPAILYCETEILKRNILLLPITNLSNNEEYYHLKSFIFNVLKVNLEKQESIYLLYPEDDIKLIISENNNFKELNIKLKEQYNCEALILGEYYLINEELHIIINVWETGSLRLKNSFIRSMPSDLDMLKNIEEMSIEIAETIANNMPGIKREALLQKYIIKDYRDKLDNNEKLLNNILNKHHEIQFSLFSGINMGRTVVSWSDDGPFIAPAINLEYYYFFKKPIHIRVGLEYLPFDLMTRDSFRTEITLESLFGYHTQSLFSLSLDTGIAIIYDYNSMCTSLSFNNENYSQRVYRESHRLSLSIPIQIGLSIYLKKSFFMNIRFKYHGFTWTIEPLEPEEYNAGNEIWKYNKGFSPWNLLCMSLTVQAGFRF